MKTKNEVLDVVENTVQVINRFGDVIGEGYRTENWSAGFRLSDNSVIKFEQVADAQPGRLTLK